MDTSVLYHSLQEVNYVPRGLAALLAPRIKLFRVESLHLSAPTLNTN